MYFSFLAVTEHYRGAPVRLKFKYRSPQFYLLLTKLCKLWSVMGIWFALVRLDVSLQVDFQRKVLYYLLCMAALQMQRTAIDSRLKFEYFPAWRRHNLWGEVLLKRSTIQSVTLLVIFCKRTAFVPIFMQSTNSILSVSIALKRSWCVSCRTVEAVTLRRSSPWRS